MHNPDSQSPLAYSCQTWQYILTYIHLFRTAFATDLTAPQPPAAPSVGFNFFLHLLILCGNELLGFVIAMMHSTYKGIIANMDI